MSAMTRDEMRNLAKKAAGDCFSLGNGAGGYDTYVHVKAMVGQPEIFTKNGQTIPAADYWAADKAFCGNMPTLPATMPSFAAVAAGASAENIAKVFNDWGRLHIVQDIDDGGTGYFTEEAVGPAKAFMADKGFTPLPIERGSEAYAELAKRCGYAQARHLGLEHQPRAAWRTPDNKIIFYCDLQGGMFVQ